MLIYISIPIRDLELSKFEMAKYFSKEGYDIYNKESNFYNDICTPASLNNNDITIDDRKKEIFPNNVTLCKSDCSYKGVNIEDKRVICQCNLIVNRESSNTKEKDNNILNFFFSDDGNFITYLLDNINFKPFKCGKLLIFFGNLKYNYFFYCISFIIVFIIIITIEFFSYRMLVIRSYLFKESPNLQKIRKQIKEKKMILRKRKTINNVKNNINFIESESKKNINNNKKTKKSLILKRKSNSIIPNKKNFKKSNFRKNSTEMRIFSNSNFIQNVKNPKMTENIKNDDNNKDDPNEMPFSRAIREDKRNMLQVLKSILFQKIDLIDLFISDEKVKEISICEFILSLLIGFFFNALLYSDEVVSHKYHNNGNLDFVVSIALSILSNIITSFVCYFLENSPLIEERLEQILEIKNEYDYFRNLKKFFRNLRIKLIIFFCLEIFVIIICFYYIVIFTIIYSRSQTSLLINYLYSLLEDIIKTLIISLIIVITRKIGISCLNKYFYNTSKYINEKF